jgi:hypothetical protein
MSSFNIFESVTNDLKATEQKILGPQYDYTKNIKSPGEMGMSSKGDLNVLGKNISGLIGYVELLVTGKTKASKTGKPLGNKFFLYTGANCKDKKTGKVVDRHIYINNVPDGSIPFITSGMDMNFTEFRGLVPGTMSNVAKINPLQILQAFSAGTNPDCQELTMETITVNNIRGRDTKYITTVDIENMSPCWFLDSTNPITKKKCREAFSSINNYSNFNKNNTEELINQLYFSSLGVFGIYILLKLFEKKS